MSVIRGHLAMDAVSKCISDRPHTVPCTLLEKICLKFGLWLTKDRVQASNCYLNGSK